ncbi:DUF2911 domain-containing protein [Leptobacterium flavescens]|uniref:DUF2911 domain-containing protein n=1 Tax=Leptobacterium flavescens TaxID=472055 RepID=A0A6P0UHW8_9FLAO|nr:DUF2911 domain-containing protein [Leptobacterium flavescens]NER12212.1 DUF2911 domain-containing protein [Leptobacterium flavescens]
MKKSIKWILILLAVLVLGLFGAMRYMKSQTKKHSPETTVEFKNDGLELSVFYNRPSKKGRNIFGGLVPYGQIWRTGANEATTFETNKDININGQKLAAGKYSVFTIPNEDSWDIIFNTKMYSWGVKIGNKPIVEREHDALVVNVQTGSTDSVVEQFTISFADAPETAMVLEWDRTKIVVPISQ